MAVDVNNWYRGVFGRDPDPGGLAYWNAALASGTASEADVFNSFKAAGTSNTEAVNSNFGINSTYVAPKDSTAGSDGSTITDEWASNNGVTLTAAQAAQLKADYDTASRQSGTASITAYNKFLKDNNVSNGVDYWAASRFGKVDPYKARFDDVTSQIGLLNTQYGTLNTSYLDLQKQFAALKAKSAATTAVAPAMTTSNGVVNSGASNTSGLGAASSTNAVYGPDGTAYSGPAAAIAAGVYNYTMFPPTGTGQPVGLVNNTLSTAAADKLSGVTGNYYGGVNQNPDNPWVNLYPT